MIVRFVSPDGAKTPALEVNRLPRSGEVFELGDGQKWVILSGQEIVNSHQEWIAGQDGASRLRSVQHIPVLPADARGAFVEEPFKIAGPALA